MRNQNMKKELFQESLRNKQIIQNNQILIEEFKKCQITLNTISEKIKLLDASVDKVSEKSILKEIKLLLKNENENFRNRIALLDYDAENSISLDFILKLAFPHLTKREVQLCNLILLGVGTKEIAQIQSIEPQSIKTAKHRLKKKMNLNQEETIKSFLEKFINDKRKDIESTKSN